MKITSILKTTIFTLALVAMVQGCSQANMVDEINPKNNPSGVRAADGRLSKTDSLALVAIYNALGGENWRPNNRWLKRSAHLWHGVVVEPVNGEKRVTQLRLRAMRLNGKLPKEIKQLTALKALEMSYNANLKGDIIEEVYELKNLETLNLRFTGITGELSPSVGKLAKLDTLDLWTSQWTLETPDWNANPDLMTGMLPKELGQLKNLRFLRLGRQGFTGELPAEIGDMQSLSFFDIAQCQFTGAIPASFGKLKNLKVLFAGWNKLSAPLPQALCEAEKLEQLFVNNNALSGSIPANVSKLKNLTHLSLEHNQLTGEIPNLSNLARLGIVYLQNNQLSGSIPASIGSDKHPHLIVADLSHNNLTGNVPPRQAHTWNGGGWWTEMIVKGNRLSGAVHESHLKFEKETRQRFLPQQAGYGFDNLK